jgi:prepilin-type N-terminal cleavage/methylation domain-containing protein
VGVGRPDAIGGINLVRAQEQITTSPGPQQQGKVRLMAAPGKFTRGFTLLELLVVLAVLSVLTAIGTRVLFSITDAWKTISVRNALEVRAAEVFDSFRRDFSQIRDFRDIQPDAISFRVECFNTVSRHTERANIAYELVRPKTGLPTLERVYSSGGETPESGNRGVLAEGVVAWRIELFDGTLWKQDWVNPAMPKAVRVSMVLQDKDRPWEQISRTVVFPIFVE